MGKGPTRRRYGHSHPRSGSRARTLYPPRWTLRENPSSQPGRDLARKYKTAQNFRNWWLRIPGTHTTYGKILQTSHLQDSHTAHYLHSVSKNAAVSGATAPKPPTNTCALIARFILPQMRAREEVQLE